MPEKLFCVLILWDTLREHKSDIFRQDISVSHILFMRLTVYTHNNICCSLLQDKKLKKMQKFVIF